MKVKFTFKVKDDNFSYNKSTTRNVDMLNNDNIERWAFENFKVTIKDYFCKNIDINACEKCLVSVKYDTTNHVYEYGKDADSNMFHYFVDDNKLHYYTTTSLFDDTIIYYGDCIVCDSNKNEEVCDEECADIELDKNVIYDIVRDFAKNTFGVEFSKDDFNKFNDMANQIIDSCSAEDLFKEDEGEEDECSRDAEDNNIVDNNVPENACQNNYDLRGDILCHFDQKKYEADHLVFHCIKLQIVDKIRQRDYKFAKISDDLKDYRDVDNVKNANGIILNITGVDQGAVTENVMKELIEFAKLEDMSNVLFDKVHDGTFNVIFKL